MQIILKRIGYLLFLLAVLEMMCRWLAGTSWFFPVIQGDYDAAWRLEWVQRHKQGNSDIYYGFDAFDPHLGWVLQKNLRNETMYGGKTVNSNARGIRGVREFAYGKPTDKKRVLVIGDSYTFGDGLNESETYAGVLQDSLPGIEVINMGIHGYGLDQVLLYLKKEGLRYHPDVVVLGFVYYDLSRNLLSFRDYAKPRFIVKDDALFPEEKHVPPPEAMLAAEWRRSRFMDLLSILKDKTESRLGWRREEMLLLGNKLLHAIADTIVAAGATPVFVYIPTGEEVYDPKRSENWVEFFEGFCNERPEVHALNLKDRFRLSRARLSFDGHWDPEGNRMIAHALQELLEEMGGEAIDPVSSSTPPHLP